MTMVFSFVPAFEKMVWPTIKQSENTEMFKSKLRYQVLELKITQNQQFGINQVAGEIQTCYLVISTWCQVFGAQYLVLVVLLVLGALHLVLNAVYFALGTLCLIPSVKCDSILYLVLGVRCNSSCYKNSTNTKYQISNNKIPNSSCKW